jgi:hypothetical protein
MKSIIITKNQLNFINEENTVNIGVKAKGNSLSDFKNTLTDVNTLSDINKASQVGDVKLTISGNKVDDTQPTQNVEVGANDTPEHAFSTQVNPALVQNGGKVDVYGDGFVKESKIFSKKMVEEARLDSMRKNGKIMTKKELNDSFKK